MKVNKWTLGLAAAGVVSLASVAQAEEAKKVQHVETLLSSTTLSGYVDTSAQWNIGPDTANFPAYGFGGAGKADGFNLNVVKISLAKPLDDNGWAAGYQVDLLFGPDAATFGTTLNGASAVTGVDSTGGALGPSAAAGQASAAAIKQAYVTLRMPIGTGLDWKIGVFDTIIGYEVFESGNNPNFTRSWGYSIEPTTHTGALASYKVVDNVVLSAGIANTQGPGINGRTAASAGGTIQSQKTYMGSIAITAPESTGFLKGSTLYAGIIDGFGGNAFQNQVNYYIGGTLATPVAGLTVGFAFDYVSGFAGYPGGGITTAGVAAPNGTILGTEASAFGLYASFKPADTKFSFHARAEFAQFGDMTATTGSSPLAPNLSVWTLTGTVQYDLWANVIARLELRYDDFRHGATVLGGTAASGAAITDTAYALIANVVYKF